MNFILDVHCHTVSSGHAYSTISENAEHAASIGLTHIGMADHSGEAMPGGAHIYHFVNIWSMPLVIKGIRVLKGVEANIMNPQGYIDMTDDMLSTLEFVIASMHRGVIAPTNCEDHTHALVNAMNNPHVHIIGHPVGAWYDVDIEEVVKAAARTRTILEINAKSVDPISLRYNGDEDTKLMIKLCKEYKVPVLASSDAHFCTDVGDFGKAKTLIEAAEMDEELVLNTSIDRFLSAIQRKKELII